MGDSEASRHAVQASLALINHVWWTQAVNFIAACVVYIISAQAYIAQQRALEASQAAARLRSALRYISHEARSPLGGAILSLTLMDDAIDEADRAACKALVGDLHVSLEAAKRHLDDLLLFEKVTSSAAAGGASGVGDVCGWGDFSEASLRRQTNAFRGACRAEGIHLTISATSGRLDIAGELERWRPGCLSGHSDLDSKRQSDSRNFSDGKPTKVPSIDGFIAATTMGRAKVAPAPSPAESQRGVPAASAAATLPMSERRRRSATGMGACGGASGWEVFANWQRVDAVVQNAVSNSVKHAPGESQGYISVSLSVGDADAFPSLGLPRGQRPEASGTSSVQTARTSNEGTGTSSHTTRRRGEQVASAAEPATPGPAAASSTGVAEGSILNALTTGRNSAGSSICRRVLVIEVLDNGRGIPAAMLQPGKLFHAFQQLRMGDSALRLTSSGLGLSIVKSIVVDQMGGEVGLASREGEGTLFFAHVPVWARQTTEATMPDRSPFQSTAQLASPTVTAVTASNTLSSQHAGLATASPAISTDGHGGGSLEATPTSSAARGKVTRHLRREARRVERASRGRARTGILRSASSPVDPAEPVQGLHSSMAGAESLPVAAHTTTDFSPIAVKRVRNRTHGRALNGGAAGSAAAAAASGRDEAASSKPVAFVVDDEKVNRSLMARILRRWGLTVVEFSDGRYLMDALRSLASPDSPGASRAWPKFITLDVQMPRLDGCGALAEMSAMASELDRSGLVAAAHGLRSIKVFGVTGHAMSDDQVRMKELGVCRVLIKPVEPWVLAEAVKEEVGGVDLPARAFKRLGES